MSGMHHLSLILNVNLVEFEIMAIEILSKNHFLCV